MPKLPKGFGRRKSTANALEDIQVAQSVTPSFKVFERPSEPTKSFDGGMTFARSQTGPLPPRKEITAERREDNMFADLKVNRGSETSNSNTVSTTDNSSRLSAASTAPSSSPHNRGPDHLYFDTRPTPEGPLPPLPKSYSAFSKATARTFSFGRGKSSSASHGVADNQAFKLNDGLNTNRPRAITGSSYASTATPPQLDDQSLGLSLGGDFADMFSAFSHRNSTILDTQEGTAVSNNFDEVRTPTTVPARSYVPSRTKQPSPLNLDPTREVEAPPYSWSSQHSADGLMTKWTPSNPPPVPRHASPQVSNRSNGSPSSQPLTRAILYTDEPKRLGGLTTHQRSTHEPDNAIDEDSKFLRESVQIINHLTKDPVSRARDSWLKPVASPSLETSPPAKPSSISEWTPNAVDSPPRTQQAQVNQREENILAPANIPSRPKQRNEERSTHVINQSGGPSNKVMTPAQFERYRQAHDRHLSVNISVNQDNDDDQDEDTYEDDEDDEAEKHKEIVKQRRKQEAHMAIYRQQMMKVTGEATTAPAMQSRPGFSMSRSTPNLNRMGSITPDDEEEDEEIPLAILAAHGFPNKSRQPGQLSSMNSNPNLRSSSQLGVYQQPNPTTESGRLPVFARNLPQDPYFGAGLVNQSNRESFAFGGGTGSAQNGGGNLPPGGLVGVIATEERSRAMRRGSPNAVGGYGPPTPSNGFGGVGTSMTMGNLNGMQASNQMLTPGDAAQLEMQQQMQQFMQMQMQFMQMMSAGGQSPQAFQERPQSQQGFAPPQGLRPSSSHQGVMSMLDPNAAPWQQQNTQRNTLFASSMPFPGNHYAPSIAPSERSNVGLPGRYRPVSQYPVGESKSRTASMSGALQDWDERRQKDSVAPIPARKTGNGSDDDEEEGWAAMRQKREKKKSTWRSKKDDTNDMKDLVNFAA